jgi:Rod binding domain-containing protein
MGPLTLPVHVSSPLDLRPLPAVRAATAEQALKIGREFEEMYLAHMLGPIFETLPTDSVLGGGFGERMFRSLQVTEYAKAIARTGGIGIADAVTREIIRLQETAHG